MIYFQHYDSLILNITGTWMYCQWRAEQFLYSLQNVCICIGQGMNTSFLNQLFLASQNSESDLEMNPLCRFAVVQGQHFSKSHDLNFEVKYKIIGLCSHHTMLSFLP